MSSMAAIEDFLAQKRLAIVGVSRKPQDFSRTLFAELRQRGYDVVPVNSGADEIDGQTCFAHVRDIRPPVEGVLIMTPSAASKQIVEECADVGINRVWMYRAAGEGAVDPVAVAFCESHDITVIPGECPFMFLPHAGWYHRWHGGFRKFFGGYPQ